MPISSSLVSLFHSVVELFDFWVDELALCEVLLDKYVYQLMKELFPAEWLPIRNTVIFFLGGSSFRPTDSATEISPEQNQEYNQNNHWQPFLNTGAPALKDAAIKLSHHGPRVAPVGLSQTVNNKTTKWVSRSRATNISVEVFLLYHFGKALMAF